MPLYLWNGPGDIEPADNLRSVAPKLTTPAGPASDPVTEAPLWVCTVKGCGRRFRKAMIAARHFNQSHEELRTSKDSWREHTKETTE